MSKKANLKERYYVKQVEDSVYGLWAIFVYRAIKVQNGVHSVQFSLPIHKNAESYYGLDLDFCKRMNDNYGNSFKYFEKNITMSLYKRITQAEYVKYWRRAKRRMLNRIKKHSALGLTYE